MLTAFVQINTPMTHITPILYSMFTHNRYIKYSKTAHLMYGEFGLTHYKADRKQSIHTTAAVITQQPYVQKSVTA